MSLSLNCLYNSNEYEEVKIEFDSINCLFYKDGKWMQGKDSLTIDSGHLAHFICSTTTVKELLLQEYPEHTSYTDLASILDSSSSLESSSSSSSKEAYYNKVMECCKEWKEIRQQINEETERKNSSGYYGKPNLIFVIEESKPQVMEMLYMLLEWLDQLYSPFEVSNKTERGVLVPAMGNIGFNLFSQIAEKLVFHYKEEMKKKEEAEKTTQVHTCCQGFQDYYNYFIESKEELKIFKKEQRVFLSPCLENKLWNENTYMSIGKPCEILLGGLNASAKKRSNCSLFSPLSKGKKTQGLFLSSSKKRKQVSTPSLLSPSTLIYSATHLTENEVLKLEGQELKRQLVIKEQESLELRQRMSEMCEFIDFHQKKHHALLVLYNNAKEKEEASSSSSALPPPLLSPELLSPTSTSSSDYSSSSYYSFSTAHYIEQENFPIQSKQIEAFVQDEVDWNS